MALMTAADGILRCIREVELLQSYGSEPNKLEVDKVDPGWRSEHVDILMIR
jgi:hypothetical protein